MLDTASDELTLAELNGFRDRQALVRLLPGDPGYLRWSIAVHWFLLFTREALGGCALFQALEHQLRTGLCIPLPPDPHDVLFGQPAQHRPKTIRFASPIDDAARNGEAKEGTEDVEDAEDAEGAMDVEDVEDLEDAEDPEDAMDVEDPDDAEGSGDDGSANGSTSSSSSGGSTGETAKD